MLTEAGAEFLARMEPILAALEEAGHSVREGGDLRGLLRMNMPTSFGIRDAIPHLAAFAARHPNLYLYRARNLLERFLNKTKQCRRITTRYDELAANYPAFRKLALIRIWLRGVHALVDHDP